MSRDGLFGLPGKRQIGDSSTIRSASPPGIRLYDGSPGGAYVVCGSMVCQNWIAAVFCHK